MSANDVTIPRLQSFLIAVSKIDPIKISVDHLFETMEKNVHELDINADQTNTFANKARLGIFWALTLSSCIGRKSVKMTGRWESVLWTMIELVTHWRMENSKDLGLLASNLLKQWVLRMFTDQKMCPNPYLRLEMIRFISMCPDMYLQEVNSGMQVVEGLVVTSVYLKLHHLDPRDLKTNLAYHFIEVLRSLNKYGHLHCVAAEAVHQLASLRVGPEAAFFSHILQLLGQLAEAIRVYYLSGNLDTFHTILSFIDICFIFEQMMVTPHTMIVSEVAGMAEVAAASLVTVTSCLVAISSSLQDEVGCRLFGVLPLLHHLYKLLSNTEKSTSICRVLRLNHAQHLSSLNKEVEKSGFSFHYFPTYEKMWNDESTEDCPEKFLDSLTQAVMEAPVLLHSSKMVVNASTLVHLLLTSPTDPFTRCPLDHGSYSRLPELQAEIVTWRNASIEDNSFYSDVEGENSNRFEMKTENSNRFEMKTENSGINRVHDDSMDYMDSIGVDKSDCELQKLLLQFGYSKLE